MSIKGIRINLRLSADLDQWLERRAGGKRGKPAFIRQLLESERQRDAEGSLQDLFDSAWDSLPDGERKQVRAEREQWIAAQTTEARIQDLRTEISEGLQQARRGELIPGGEIRERIRRKSRERRK